MVALAGLPPARGYRVLAKTSTPDSRGLYCFRDVAWQGRSGGLSLRYSSTTLTPCRIAVWTAPGRGPRWLENPTIAALFVEALLYRERVRGSYDLFAWAVMPNHVHIVLKPHEKLPEVVRWMKTASAARANRLTGREYFGTWMRTSQKLASVVAYVEENPVTVGLALRAEDWPRSSASKYTGGETAGAPKMSRRD